MCARSEYGTPNFQSVSDATENIARFFFCLGARSAWTLRSSDHSVPNTIQAGRAARQKDRESETGLPYGTTEAVGEQKQA